VWRSVARPEPGNSESIAELMSGAGAAPGPSTVAAAFGGLPSSEELAVSELASAPSSPAELPPGRARGFWFRVNAEVILHGSTEPDAKVTIGGRAVKLRPDGSFSFRFSLPDGEHELPVIAISAAGDDGRAAVVQFGRSTEIIGEVGVHPIDPALRRPEPESVS
jgi:hypothetical protein